MLIFREIELDDARMLLDWRLNPEDARWGLTKVDNDMAKQKNWILSMREFPDSYHWIINLNSLDIGYCKISKISKDFAEEGAYISKPEYKLFHGPIFRDFLRAVFIRFNFNYLISSVIEGNPILRIIKMFGYEYDLKKPDIILEEKNGLKLKHFLLKREKFFKMQPCRDKMTIPDLPMEMWKYKNLF